MHRSLGFPHRRGRKYARICARPAHRDSCYRANMPGAAEPSPRIAKVVTKGMPGAGMSVTKGRSASGWKIDRTAARLDSGVSAPAAQRKLKRVSGICFSRTKATVTSSASGSIDFRLTERKLIRQSVWQQKC